MRITNGYKKCASGVKHGIKTADTPRVAHGNWSGGQVSSHAGQTPRIKNSVNHSKDQLVAARKRGAGPMHVVRISGKGFSGKVR